jgi:RNA polymerase sigma-70 factor, ECF subfamily
MADEHRFERHLEAAWAEHRGYLLNIAYRLLGSLEEAEDMVQEAYLRLLRSDLDAIADLRGWLVVVTTRICLDHLGSARVRREARTDSWLPEPIVRALADPTDPADVVVLDESVRMALLIVLERLKPAERVVFVLHDVFQYSFEEIGPMVGRTPAACRQLASRGASANRRRTRGRFASRRGVDAASRRALHRGLSGRRAAAPSRSTRPRGRRVDRRRREEVDFGASSGGQKSGRERSPNVVRPAVADTSHAGRSER